jgi:hypothetical protein
MHYSQYSESSLNQSSFYQPSRKRRFDPEVVEKLISYVEQTLDAKLKSISKLVQKNKMNLGMVKKDYSVTEMEVMKMKRQVSGEEGSLLSEDIKFFFNMVKNKPNIAGE